MGFFDIGNLIVLLVSAIMIFASRRFDQQNRSIEAVRRFLEKARKDFEDETKERQERLLGLGDSLNSFEKNSKELLKRFQSDYQTAVNEASNLEEVKGLILEMVEQKEKVFSVLENLKKDDSFVSKLSKDLDHAKDKMRSIEQSSERLLGELSDRNFKTLENYKNIFLDKIDEESVTLQNDLKEQIQVAQILKNELDGVYAKKETALIASLKIYNSEFENLQKGYLEHFKQIEESNINKLKVFEEHLSRMEESSMRKIEQEFKESLEQELSTHKAEYEAFIQKYSNLQFDLSNKFQFLADDFSQMEDKQKEFDYLMKNLGTFMDEEFLKESNRIHSMIGEKITQIENNLLEDNNKKFKNLEDSFNVQLNQVSVIGDTALEQINLLSDAYKLKEEALSENIRELADDLLHLKESSMASFKEQEEVFRRKWQDLELFSDDAKHNVDKTLDSYLNQIEGQFDQKISQYTKDIETALMAKIAIVEEHNLAKIEQFKLERFSPQALDQQWLSTITDLSDKLQRDLHATKDEVEHKIASYYDEAETNLSNEFEGKLNKLASYFENQTSTSQQEIDNYKDTYLRDIEQMSEQLRIGADSFSLQADELKEIIGQKVSAVEQDIVHLEGIYKSKIESTEQEISNLEAIYKDKITTAEDDIAHWEVVYKDKISVAEQDIINLENSYKDKIATSLEQWQSWSERSKTMEQQFNMLNEQAETQQHNVETFFANLKADASEKIDILQKEILSRFDGQYSLAFEDVKVKVNELDEAKSKLEHKIDLLEEMVAQRGENLKNNMESSLKGVWDNLNELRDGYNEKYQQFFTDFEQEQQNSINSLNTNQEQILRRLGEFDNSIDDKLADLVAARDRIFQESDINLNKLELDIESKIDASQIKIDDLNRNWQERLEDVKSIYNNKLQESNSLFDKYKEDINANFSKLSDEFDGKLSILNSGIDEHLNQVNVRAELIEGAWAERYETYTDKLSQRLEQSEHLIEEQILTWKSNTEAIENSLNVRLREASDLALGWDEKLAEAKEQMDIHWNSLNFDKKVLDDRWNEKIVDLRKQAEVEILAFEQEQQLVEQAFKDKIARIVSDVDEWSLKLEDLTKDKMAELEQKWQASFDGFSSKDEQRMRVVADQADQVDKFWQEQLGQFNQEIENKMQSLEQEFTTYVAGVEQAWQNKLQEVNNILQDKDNDFKNQLDAVDNKAKDLREHFEDLSNGLNNDLEKSKTLVHDELAKQLEALSVQVKSEWEGRLDDLKVNVMERIEQSKNMMRLLNESSQALEDDKDGFKQKIDELTHDIDEMYENGKLKMDEAFRGFDNGLASWQVEYHNDLDALKNDFMSTIDALNRDKALLANEESEIARQISELGSATLDFNSKFDDLYHQYSVDFEQRKEIDEDKLDSYLSGLDSKWQQLEHQLNNAVEESLHKMKLLLNVHDEQIAMAKLKVDQRVDENIDHISKAWEEKLYTLEQRHKKDEEILTSLADANSLKVDQIGLDVKTKFVELDLLIASLKHDLENKMKINIEAITNQSTDFERSNLLKYQEFSSNLQSEMSNLENKVSDLAGIYFSKQQELELLFDDRMTEINDSWEIFNSKLEDKQRVLDSDFSDRVEIVQKRLSDLENDLKSKQDDFESTFSSRLGTSIANLKDMQEKFDKQSLDFDHALELQVANAEASLKELEQEFSGKQTKFELEFQERLDKAGQEVDVLLSSYKDKYLEFDEEFKANFDETMAKVNSLDKIVADKNREFSDKAHDSFVKLESDFNQQANLLSQKTIEIEDKFNALKEQADGIFIRSEQSVQLKAEQIDIMLDQNRAQTEELATLIEQNKNLFLSGMEQFSAQIDDLFNRRRLDLDALIDNYHVDSKHKIESVFNEQFNNIQKQMDDSKELLSNHDKDIQQKILNYQDTFSGQFNNLDEIVVGFQKSLEQKNIEISQLKSSIDSDMSGVHSKVATEIVEQEELLRATISASIKKTGDDLTLELLNSVEARLSEYEEIVRSKMQRLEFFMSDVDSVEENLKASFVNIQKEVVDNIAKFESEIRQRYDKELSYIMEKMATSQSDLEQKITSVNGMISSVKDEAELLKDKFNDTMSQYLGEFEGQLENEKDKLQDILKNRINDIEQKIALDEDSKKTLFLQNLKKFELELQKEQDSLQSRLEESLASLEKRATLLDKEHASIDVKNKANLADLSSKVNSDSDLIKQKLQNLEQIEIDYKDKMASMQTKIDSSLEKLLQGQLHVDSTINEAIDGFNKQFKIEQEAFEQKIKDDGIILDRKLESLLNSKIIDAQATIDREFNSFNDKVQTLVYGLQSQSDAINNELEQLKSSVDTKVEQFASLAGEEVELRFSEIQNTLQSRLGEIEVVTKNLSEQVKSQLANDKLHIDEMVAIYKNDFDKLKIESSTKLSNASAEIDDKLDVLGKMVEAKTEAIDSYYEQIKRGSEDFIQTSRDSFNEKIEQFARVAEQERNKYSQNLDNVSAKLSKLEENVVKQANNNIDKITKISTDSINEITRKSKIANKDIDDKTAYLRNEIGSMKDQLDTLKSRLENSINDGANKLADRLSDIENRQRDFENATPVFEEIEKMRKDLEYSISSLDKGMQQVRDQESELKDIDAKLQEAFNLNEALTSKIDQLNMAKNKVDELDNKTASVMKLSDAVEHKISKISSVSQDLEDIKDKLQSLSSFEQELTTKLSSVEEKSSTMTSLNSAIRSSEDRMTEIEVQIAQAIDIYRTMEKELSNSQESFKQLNEYEPKLNHLIQFFSTIDDKVKEMEDKAKEMEEKVSHIDNMRDWMVSAEQSLRDLNEEAKHNIGLGASVVSPKNTSKRSSASSEDSIDSRPTSASDTIIKLKDQGWSAKEIASHLKLSINQVNLVLERNRSR